MGAPSRCTSDALIRPLAQEPLLLHFLLAELLEGRHAELGLLLGDEAELGASRHRHGGAGLEYLSRRKGGETEAQPEEPPASEEIGPEPIGCRPRDRLVNSSPFRLPVR
jgi:hypothetical protein